MAKLNKYFESVGRHKTSVARVRIFSGKLPKELGDDKFVVNKKQVEVYFPVRELADVAQESLIDNSFSVSVMVFGGGVKSQAMAVRLGVGRALEKYDPELRPTLKAEGYLRRDPRKKERKKPGLLKARRAPQWSKR